MRTQGTYYIRGTERRKEGRTEGRTEGRKAENYVPPLFFEKAGDNNETLKMEGSKPTPYFFVKEIFLNIIIALRRLFIIFLLYLKCAKFAYVRKSGHVYAFTHVCKICTYAKVGKFAPASDQVQISFCVYAKFAYMQIWSCEQKAKFAHVIVLNNS